MKLLSLLITALLFLTLNAWAQSGSLPVTKMAAMNKPQFQPNPNAPTPPNPSLRFANPRKPAGEPQYRGRPDGNPFLQNVSNQELIAELSRRLNASSSENLQMPVSILSCDQMIFQITPQGSPTPSQKIHTMNSSNCLYLRDRVMYLLARTKNQPATFAECYANMYVLFRNEPDRGLTGEESNAGNDANCRKQASQYNAQSLARFNVN